MARVVALIPDLLFGSRVQADLTGAGHEVELVGNLEVVGERLAGGNVADVDVLVVDLTDERLEGPELVEGLRGVPQELGASDDPGASPAVKTLGFYSHVDVAVRERAEQAGFDLVVPRSRMAREGAALVDRLAGA